MIIDTFYPFMVKLRFKILLFMLLFVRVKIMLGLQMVVSYGSYFNG